MKLSADLLLNKSASAVTLQATRWQNNLRETAAVIQAAKEGSFFFKYQPLNNGIASSALIWIQSVLSSLPPLSLKIRDARGSITFTPMQIRRIGPRASLRRLRGDVGLVGCSTPQPCDVCHPLLSDWHRWWQQARLPHHFAAKSRASQPQSRHPGHHTRAPLSLKSMHSTDSSQLSTLCCCVGLSCQIINEINFFMLTRRNRISGKCVVAVVGALSL